MTFPVQLISQFTQPAYQQSYTVTNTPSLTEDFTVPDGVFTLSAVVVGAGGGGSGGGGGGGGRSGGGGGGGLTWGIFSVQPGDVLTVNIGASGLGGSTNNSGTNGGDSSVVLKSRNGVTINKTIILAQGGRGGSKGTGSGGGGAGIQPDPQFPTNFKMFVRGGGSGGDGGTVLSGTDLGAGGGGAGGYTGSGGVGGGWDGGPINPTSAASASGGGGGGGYSIGNGYGGGGVGAFGFDGTSQGIAGVNNSSGGGGGSFFNDPGSPIAAQFVGSASTDQTFISYSDVKDNLGNSVTFSDNDFLVLLSAADTSVPGAPISISVPNSTDFPTSGFTTIVSSNNSEYIAKWDDPSDIRSIPDTTIATGDKLQVAYNPNPSISPTRDINFSSSYAYIPSGGLTKTSLDNLDSNCIHNLVALRFIPGTTINPADFLWRNTSGDPALNPTAGGCETLMPNPPAVPGVPAGAVSIISGYLANCVLNSGTTAGQNSLTLGFINGGIGGVIGEGVGITGQYTDSQFQATGAIFGGNPIVSTTYSAGTTVKPDEFLTGTSAHSRCYTLEIRRTNSGTPVTLVGTAFTASYFLDPTNPSPSNFRDVTDDYNFGFPFALPSGTQIGDLIIVACAIDGPSITTQVDEYPNARFYSSVGGAPESIQWRSDIQFEEFPSSNDNRFNGSSEDPRGAGGMGYYVGYFFATQNGGSMYLDFPARPAAPSAVMASVYRGGTPVTTGANTYAIWDNRTIDPLNPDAGDPGNGDANFYQAPDPGQITTSSNNSAVISIAMIDNIGISNISTIQPPTGYVSLAATSYGVPNDGAVVMSAIKTGLTAGTENSDAFIGDGGNIWAAQTLIIGGPGSETGGTNVSGGIWGGGGGGTSSSSGSNGSPGGAGSVRLLWGSARAYPLISQGTGNVSTGITSWVP